MESNNSQTSEQ